MGARRLIGAGLVALACATVAGTALAAPVSGERHLPYFSVMDQRVAVEKLPLELRIFFGGIPGAGGLGSRRAKGGPVWFGQAERPKMTILAAGNSRWVCEVEQPKDEMLGGGGGCTTLGASRELLNLDVSSCGRGRPRQFRIVGLVPDGVTALEIERADGSVGRTVPVIENTVAFTVGREDIVLRGVGNRAAEGLERPMRLVELSKLGGDRGGCGSYIVAEAKGG